MDTNNLNIQNLRSRVHSIGRFWLKASVIVLISACSWSCSGNSNESNQGANETPVLGREGDTTMSNTTEGAPIQAPADSASSQGSTLPQTTVTPNNSGSANQGNR